MHFTFFSYHVPFVYIHCIVSLLLLTTAIATTVTPVHNYTFNATSTLQPISPTTLVPSTNVTTVHPNSSTSAPSKQETGNNDEDYGHLSWMIKNQNDLSWVLIAVMISVILLLLCRIPFFRRKGQRRSTPHSTGGSYG